MHCSFNEFRMRVNILFGYGIYKKSAINLLNELYKANEATICKLKEEILNLEDSVGLLSFLNSIKDEEIINIVSNKYQEKFLVLKRFNGNSMQISLKNQFTSFNSFPDVYVTLNRETKNENEGDIWYLNKSIFIEDIHAINKRAGNGRILINTIICFAKEHRFKMIEGKLKEDDKLKTPGLPDFYREMGFNVNKEETYFKMKL